MGYLTPKEACEAYGVSFRALKQKLRRGTIKGIQINGIWHYEPPIVDSNYDALIGQWVKEQANGYHTGKPMGRKGIEANTSGLANIWRYLKQEPSIQALTPQALRLSLSSVPIDYEARTCQYSIREQMYKGACSFTKLLIREGLKTEADLLEMRKQKPKRVFPPRRKVVKEDQLARMLSWLEVKGNGRTDFDIALSRVIIALMAYAGLRRAGKAKDQHAAFAHPSRREPNY